tara:strand:- start:4727 stop:5044 length:318 start_codon:yes stop_codon:yes gene_type:complete
MTLLTPQTNSSAPVPEFAQVSVEELERLHETYADLIDWDKTPAVDYIAVGTSPSVYFLDENEDDWECDDDYWEESGIKISKDKVTILFIHTESGHELFFDFEPNK